MPSRTRLRFWVERKRALRQFRRRIERNAAGDLIGIITEHAYQRDCVLFATNLFCRHSAWALSWRTPSRRKLASATIKLSPVMMVMILTWKSVTHANGWRLSLKG